MRSGPSGGKYMIIRDLRKPFATQKEGEKPVCAQFAPLYSSHKSGVNGYTYEP
jgi:hypothetical protein